MDTATIIALATLALALVAGLATALLRFGKVEAAAETAREALRKTEEVSAELADFKEKVAQNYATASMVASVEARVVAAIDRLGDRIDRILEARPNSPRPRSPTK